VPATCTYPELARSSNTWKNQECYFLRHRKLSLRITVTIIIQFSTINLLAQQPKVQLQRQQRNVRKNAQIPNKQQGGKKRLI